MRLFAIAAPTTTWSKPRLSSSRTSRTKCRQSFASAAPWVACARPFACASRPRNRRAKMNLEGKTALVTGASRGIGPHLAAALAGRGMNLVLAGRSAGELEAVAAEQRKLGVSVLAVATDLLDADARTLLVGACEREFGGVDVLVNNAGGDPLREFDEMSIEENLAILDLNLSAPIALTHLVLPGMLARGRGHIVNISAMAGRVSFPFTEAYAAAK
ncbi:MAG: SDR family NAD(P)-dependent oxidoreductase, partial [Chloroflexi bacterium]